MIVEIRAEGTDLPALAEERAEALLVTPALAQELLRPLALEVAPFANEDRRDVELLCDDTKVGAEREPDSLGRGSVVGDGIQRLVERPGSLVDGLEEQILLGVDPGVDRRLLDAERLRQVADRRAVVALLGEEPRGLTGELGPAGGDTLSLTIVR